MSAHRHRPRHQLEVEMLTATATLAQAGRSYNDHMDWDDGAAWVMVTMMILITVAVVGGIVWAILSASRSPDRAAHGPATSAGPNARDLLDQRYARGEIDTADYEERRSRLS
jgi:putative membrane protein